MGVYVHECVHVIIMYVYVDVHMCEYICVIIMYVYVCVYMCVYVYVCVWCVCVMRESIYLRTHVVCEIKLTTIILFIPGGVQPVHSDHTPGSIEMTYSENLVIHLH